MTNCFCGKNTEFENCCQPLLENRHKATTAEQLMRSRYAAYCVANANYLIATTHQSERKHHNETDILDWAQSNSWIKLEVIASTETSVEFKAHFRDENQRIQIHHEKSTFVFENGQWYYVDGVFY